MTEKKFKDYTLSRYLDSLASRNPVPGGGSASALVGAMGTALLSMVIQYSLGKGKPAPVEKQLKKYLTKTEKYRRQFLQLVDLDAEAYLKIVSSRQKSQREKDKVNKAANQISLQICRYCFQAIDPAPFLVKYGNQHLMSDIEAALEMLLAAFNSSMAMIQANQ